MSSLSRRDLAAAASLSRREAAKKKVDTLLGNGDMDNEEESKFAINGGEGSRKNRINTTL